RARDAPVTGLQHSANGVQTPRQTADIEPIVLLLIRWLNGRCQDYPVRFDRQPKCPSTSYNSFNGGGEPAVVTFLHRSFRLAQLQPMRRSKRFAAVRTSRREFIPARLA